MRAISHSMFAKMIQRALDQHKLSLTDAAKQLRLSSKALAMVMAGKAYFTPRIAAGFGKLLERDFATPYAQYSLGLYADEFVKGLPEIPIIEKTEMPRDLRFLVKQIIGQNPEWKREGIIAQLIGLGIPADMAEQEVQFNITNQRTGDYDEGSRNSAI